MPATASPSRTAWTPSLPRTTKRSSVLGSTHPSVAGSSLLVEGTAVSVEGSVHDDGFKEIGRSSLVDGVGAVPVDRGRRFLMFHATWPGGDRSFYFPVEVVPRTETPSPMRHRPGTRRRRPHRPARHRTVPVPDLIGLDDQAAMQALNDLGFTWIVAYREHPDAPDWDVVGQSPAPGPPSRQGRGSASRWRPRSSRSRREPPTR